MILANAKWTWENNSLYLDDIMTGKSRNFWCGWKSIRNRLEWTLEKLTEDWKLFN